MISIFTKSDAKKKIDGLELDIQKLNQSLSEYNQKISDMQLAYETLANEKLGLEAKHNEQIKDIEAKHKQEIEDLQNKMKEVTLKHNADVQQTVASLGIDAEAVKTPISDLKSETVGSRFIFKNTLNKTI